MKKLNIFTFTLFILYPIFSYSKANSEFNKIEDKINYLNHRLGFLYFELEKAETLMFRATALITKKERFTGDLQERLASLSDCGNKIKTNSADFRLQKWLYTLSKKLKSEKKHIIKDMMRAKYEIDKTNLDNEISCLKQHAENLDSNSCGFLICSIEKLLTRIDSFYNSYDKAKKEERCLIGRIDEIRQATCCEKRDSGCCCWV